LPDILRRNLLENSLREFMIANMFVYLNRIQSWAIIPPWRRPLLLKLFGIDCDGQNIIIRDGCFFGSRRIKITSGVFINHQCYFDGSDGIELNENVHLGQRVTILTGTHDIGNSELRAGRELRSSVVIEAGAWIGAGATILPGTTVAHGCIIAAGAVVTRSTQPNGLYGGVPAIRIRDI
jgi:acetyltransferase-like isoleucine patch superfamily enzyme